MKQYRGGHNETWGGVTINIDSNYLELSGTGTPPPVSTPAPAPAPAPAPVPETHCGGTRVDFPAYYTLKPRAASRARTLALQCLLKEKKRYVGKLDGVYDRPTRRAAGAWMKSRGFTAHAARGGARTGSPCSPARTGRCWPSAPPAPPSPGSSER